MKRVAIIGSSCSGKTTLSKRIESLLGYKRIELDAIHWMADWQERETEEFRQLVGREIEAEHWVCDGNYSGKLGNLVLDRADTIVWLNLPFLVVYGRLWPRVFRRVFRGETLWNGNRESLYLTLFDKDSLLYFIPRTWRQRNRRLRQLFDAVPPGKTLVEFTRTRDVDQWLASLAPGDLPPGA